ncbi:MAG TPA: hypothetical protein DGO89_01065, partial [Microcoleaceae bacterium UBA9251]|nr:hypothetical protein [Microcoleaceae cyanobacterium UBA9251]
MRGEQEVVKVSLFKGDLGGLQSGGKPGDPPQPPLIRGEQEVVKFSLIKGDLGGSESGIKVPLVKG